MNAHELARALLAGPDLPVEIIDDEYGDREINVVKIEDERVVLDHEIELVSTLTLQEREQRRQASYQHKMAAEAAADAEQQVDF